MQAELIDALGGSRALAKELGVRPNIVWNWRDRDNIAWAYRHQIARIATKKKIPLPDGFLDPTTRKRPVKTEAA